MPFGAAIALGGAYLAADAQKDAAKSAARSSQRSTDAAIAEQQAARDANQRNIQPYLDFGNTSLGQLQRLQSGDMSAFTADPGYQFSLDQALESVRNRGAAGGNYGGGGTTSDLLRTATGLAQQGYGDYYSRLFNAAGLGQNAAVGAGSTGMQTASNIGNLLTANAGQQGQSYINQANANSNLYGQLGTLAGNYFTGLGSNSGATTSFNPVNYNPYNTSQGGGYNFGNNMANFTGNIYG